MSSLQNICLLGGSGFVGTELAAHLAERGKTIRVLSRDLRKLKSLRVVPTIELRQVDPYDAHALHEAVKDQDVVINLIAILNSGVDGTFEKTHIGIAENIISAVRDTQVQRILQVSSLHADTEGPSDYLKSKGRAGELLMQSGLPVTLFCPSVIFGNGDGLYTRFASLLRALPFMPLACPDSRMAPVFVGDVARVMADAIDNPETIGQSFNLCGPDEFTLREIVEYTADVIDVKRPIIGLPDFLARLQATIMEWVPGKPFTRDNYKSLQIDSVCNACDTPQPTPVSKVVPTYLGKMNRQSRLQHYRRMARRD